jgi:energy-coupling factor transport system permease protein
MITNITIGRYIPKDSLIHKMDPRSKILATILFIVAIFIPENVFVYLAVGVFIFFIMLASRINLKVYFKGLSALKYLLVFMAFFNLFFIKEGYVIELWKLKIYSGALTHTVFILSRIILLVTYTSILTLTTTPMELTDGIESLLKPFEKVKVPAHDIAMMISIALRFIPTLLDETEKIMKAQTSRGVDFIDSKLKEKIIAIVSLLVPLFISAFKRAEELANARDARGYKGGDGRTKYRVLKWKVSDTFYLVAHVVVIVLIVAIGR